jgi:uncharacterized protein
MHLLPVLFRRKVLLAVALLDLLILAAAWRWHRDVAPSRVVDRVGIISAAEQRNYNWFLEQMHRESGIDLRIVLVPTVGNSTPEQFALATMRQLGIGQGTGRRGLLIVYDTLARTMRVEIGPKLEGILPDAFVGYLVREHLDPFFNEGSPDLGLRTTLFMIHWRVRMARLGEEYDPSFEEYVRDVRRLAAGGGASARLLASGSRAGFINRYADSAAKAFFRPQPTVEEAYRRHLEWLALGGGQVNVPLFTKESHQFLERLPLSPAFNAYLLATEYGRSYAIDQRGDLAMLYYTDDPFLSPKFFRRTPAGWQMDVWAEVINSQETVGLAYTWRLIVSGDEFSWAFADRYVEMKVPGATQYFRVAGGDNRTLPIGSARLPVASEEVVPRSRGPQPVTSSGPPQPLQWIPVDAAAARIQAARGRPAVVLLYGIWNDQTLDAMPAIVGAAERCRSAGAEILAFHTDQEWRAVSQLPGRLAAQGAPWPPLQLRQWPSGHLSATMEPLGIRIEKSWLPPFVAVLDRNGLVVWQEQGVTRWDAVPCGT